MAKDNDIFVSSQSSMGALANEVTDPTTHPYPDGAQHERPHTLEKWVSHLFPFGPNHLGVDTIPLSWLAE